MSKVTARNYRGFNRVLALSVMVAAAMSFMFTNIAGANDLTKYGGAIIGGVIGDEVGGDKGALAGAVIGNAIQKSMTQTNSDRRVERRYVDPPRHNSDRRYSDRRVHSSDRRNHRPMHREEVCNRVVVTTYVDNVYNGTREVWECHMVGGPAGATYTAIPNE